MAEIEEEPIVEKKSGLVGMLLSVILLSALAAGGGWYIGNIARPPVTDKSDKIVAGKDGAGEESAEAGKKDGDGEGETRALSTLSNGIVELDPITTNLYYPSDHWVRLQLALYFEGEVDKEMAIEIQQEVMAFMRTVSLPQIEGPRGFRFLRDDLKELVLLRSKGKVSDILVRTFVIE